MASDGQGYGQGVPRHLHVITPHNTHEHILEHPLIQVITKHLYTICTMLAQRRRRWASVVQMLYKCFVFAGITRTSVPSVNV